MGDEKEFLKVKVGAHAVIPAFEEALFGMKLGKSKSRTKYTSLLIGGVRRIVVPVSIGYPDNSFRNIGPRPTTFSVKKHTFK